MDNILGLFEKLESQSLAVQPSRCVVVRNAQRFLPSLRRGVS